MITRPEIENHDLTIEDLKSSTNPYIQKLAANNFILTPSTQQSFKEDLGRSLKIQGELSEEEEKAIQKAYSQECVGIFYSSLQTLLNQLCLNNKICIPVHPGIYEGIVIPKTGKTSTKLESSEGRFSITVAAGAKPTLAAIIPGSIVLTLELTDESYFKLTQIKTTSLLLKDILMQNTLPDLNQPKYAKEIQIQDGESVTLLNTLATKSITPPKEAKPVPSTKPKSFHQTYKSDIRFGAGMGAIFLGVIGIGIALAAAFIPYVGPELCKFMFSLSIGWIAGGLTALGLLGGATVGAGVAAGCCAIDYAKKNKTVVPAPVMHKQSPQPSQVIKSNSVSSPSQQGHFARTQTKMVQAETADVSEPSVAKRIG